MPVRASSRGAAAARVERFEGALLAALLASSAPASTVFTSGVLASGVQVAPASDATSTGALRRLELAALLSEGDPIAMAPSFDERSLFVVEGTRLLELDLAGEPGAELARGVVDARVLALAHDGSALWIAGGERGLLRATRAGDALTVELFDRPAHGALCTAVARAGSRVLAAYAGHGTSELRVLEAAGGKLVARLALGAARPYALAVRESMALLALGTQGVGRVDLDAEPLQLVAGPELARFEGPPGCRLPMPFARDLALAGERLYVAGDGGGLIEIDLGSPFGHASSARRVDLLPPGELGYVVRVAGQGARVAAGILRGPAQVADGAPFGLLGPIGPGGEIGGLSPADYPSGRTERIVVLAPREGALAVEHDIALEPCGWRSLALGERRIYSQHLGLGTQVLELPREGAPRRVLERRPLGLPAIDGAASVIDPDVLYFGTDSAGSRPRGWARSSEGALRIDPESLGFQSPGLLAGEPIADADGEREWLLGGRGFAPSLLRARPRPPCELARWPLTLPQGADGERGHTYFFSHIVGDLAVVVRAGSHQGLVGWSLSELQAEARAVPPGTPLATPARFQARTHGELLAGVPMWMGRPRSARLPDGRLLLAVAAGARHASAAQEELVGRTLLFELRGLSEPVALAELRGPAPGGLAMALELGWIDGRLLAFTGDFAGSLAIHDVTDPSDPIAGEPWRTPPAVFDGGHVEILDLALDERSAELFVAAGRGGLFHLRARARPKPHVELVEAHATAGWAAGLFVDERRVLVGDQRAGLRLYRRVTEAK